MGGLEMGSGGLGWVGGWVRDGLGWVTLRLS